MIYIGYEEPEKKWKKRVWWGVGIVVVIFGIWLAFGGPYPCIFTPWAECSGYTLPDWWF